MSKNELEDKLIEACQEYMQEHGLDVCHFNFALHVYPDEINPCLCIDATN